MPLFKRPRSKVLWYSFYFQGKRYRGSTEETTKQAAATKEAAALTKLMEGQPITNKADKPPMLQVFAVRFLEWSENSRHLDPSTKKFYKYGWRLLSFSRLATMTIDQITPEVVDCIKFMRPVMDRRTKQQTDAVIPCSTTYTNQALRTLKVMFGKAEEWGLVSKRPKIRTLKALGRDQMIDGDKETALQGAYQKPTNHPHTRRRRDRAWMIMVILQDSGMRPDEVFPMRIEDIHWKQNRIWIPSGKTPNSTRFVGMSERMEKMLSVWCSGREGWVFPNPHSKSGHLQSIAKGFQQARKHAKLDPRIVPYSARHTYGTFTMAATGNAFAVSKSMGHADIKSMAPYQHQDINPLNEAINQRNRKQIADFSVGHNFSHNTEAIQ
jgi:integrase